MDEHIKKISGNTLHHVQATVVGGLLIGKGCRPYGLYTESKDKLLKSKISLLSRAR